MQASEYKGAWPWKNFRPHEVACRCCGELWQGDAMPEFFKKAMDALQHARDLFGAPLVINSGHRCKAHNARVGGVAKSRHLHIAFDIACKKQEQARLMAALEEAGFTGMGIYASFVHADLGPRRRWHG